MICETDRVLSGNLINVVTHTDSRSVKIITVIYSNCYCNNITINFKFILPVGNRLTTLQLSVPTDWCLS